MDLGSITVTGFRRFVTRTTLQTAGKLVALVGPNEAGKSSLIDALAMIAHDDPPASSDFSRGAEPSSFSLEARFFLSRDDLAAADLDGPHWLVVTKSTDGGRIFSITPRPPRRDTSARALLHDTFLFSLNHPKFTKATAQETIDALSTRWPDIKGILTSEAEDLAEKQMQQVADFQSDFTPHLIDSLPAKIRGLPGLHELFVLAENAPNPYEKAVRALRERLPDIILFDEDARNLAPEYEIASLSDDIPVALGNLCAVAELDLAKLISAHASSITADISTIEGNANKTLEHLFKTDWRQSGVHVSIRVQNDSLAIQVVNELNQFTSLAERSDGLRQFVALLAFSKSNWNAGSILLIDEAEQRLHYDAQADLVQMLARQQIASKVIYTTHSAGCLPEDLGNGVRFARPCDDDATRSEVRNNFWAESDPGFTPLLYGMGASTLAFFPTRNAVMVEGPSDMLLLPSMVRAALGAKVLGFQFVPGLSYADGPLHAPAIGKISGLIYLVDGDKGGASIKRRLLSSGISSENIFTLVNKDESAVDVEDFLEPSILLDGINLIIDQYYGGSPKLSIDDLSSTPRMDAAERKFRSNTKRQLEKVPLAYNILNLMAENPERAILDPRRSLAFRTIARKIEARFKAMG